MFYYYFIIPHLLFASLTRILAIQNYSNYVISANTVKNCFGEIVREIISMKLRL